MSGEKALPAGPQLSCRKDPHAVIETLSKEAEGLGPGEVRQVQGRGSHQLSHLPCRVQAGLRPQEEGPLI